MVEHFRPPIAPLPIKIAPKGTIPPSLRNTHLTKPILLRIFQGWQASTELNQQKHKRLATEQRHHVITSVFTTSSASINRLLWARGRFRRVSVNQRHRSIPGSQLSVATLRCSAVNAIAKCTFLKKNKMHANNAYRF